LFRQPKWAFYGATTRRTDSGTVWNPQEKLTVQESNEEKIASIAEISRSDMREERNDRPDIEAN
jgi:hypothetical protein